MQRKVIATAAAVGLGALLSMSSDAKAVLIIGDNFNAASSATSGFDLNTGVNSGINPPSSTRLGGTAADNLRWIPTFTGKPSTSYTLGSDANFRVSSGAQGGRASLGTDATNPASLFDFGPALGISSATPSAPVVYDIAISMQNLANSSATSTARMSFGWATTNAAVTGFDFGIQLFKTAADSTNYQYQKRIDNGSSGLVADSDDPMLASPSTAAARTLVPFLMRVTDAGAETTTFNSRVQVSVDNGATWIYDTLADSSLTNGFRFDGASRFFIFDIAANNPNAAVYDDLSINTIVPEPGTIALAAAAAGLVLTRRRRA